MSKYLFLFLILFSFAKSELYEGVPVHDINKLSRGGKKEVSLTVKEGEEFALKFQGNPTTGYMWVLLNLGQLDDSLQGINIKKDGIAAYVPNSREKKLDGGAGHFYYKFKALKVTNEEKTLNFSYRRPWEKGTNEPSIVVKINIVSK